MKPSAEDPLEARLAALLSERRLGEAATAVVEGYGPAILGYLGVLLREDEAVREAFSEFGEELWKALPRFEGRSSVKTWAYSIAYHAALRYRRARARRRTRPLRDSEHSRLAASVRATSHAFSRSSADRRLEALRATLTDEERTLLVLRLDRDMAWQEIATVLGTGDAVSEAALRKRFQRLKSRLRQQAVRTGLIGTHKPARPRGRGKGPR